jgi:predicted acetyltransferase
VPHATVTGIGVMPTHQRRGIFTALLERQLADIADRGEVLASLRATDARLYERFGYSIASRAASFEIDRRRGALRSTVPEGGPVRLVDRAQARKLLPEIYQAASWTGAIGRGSCWWNQDYLWLDTVPGPSYVAIHGPAGQEDGYVTYHPVNTPEWHHGHNLTVVADELVAHTDQAYLGLIRHLAGLDIVDIVRLPTRPADDPLPELFADPRAVSLVAMRDETWLRVIDVAQALAARRYNPAAAAVVISVADRRLPGNSGSYRIDPDGAGRSGQAADISTDVAGLSAAYLGGVRWSALGRGGRAAEHRPGALAAADRLFATLAEPFAGTAF